MVVLGIMSGTSLDGVDLALVNLKESKSKLEFTFLKTKTVAYSKNWHKCLKCAHELEAKALNILSEDYGNLLATTIKSFLETCSEQPDLIASHGHTIYHNPSESYTLQIGNGPYINAITGVKTICNFRVQDIALGGQGAPLVPIGDALLFSKYDYCLNLGGFSNISMKENDLRIAYDICPVNIVLNHYVNSLNLEYDNNGEIASTGTIETNLLEELNELPFYNDVKPKSLGYEFIVETIFPIINKYNLKTKDILRTFVEHIAMQIAKKIESNSSKTMLIAGGGAYNGFLIERLQSYTKTQLIIPNDEIINYKEALVFALLGYLKNEEKNNCLKSVTGASKNHSSGIIYNA